MKFKNLFMLLVMCILLCQPVLAEKRLKAAMTTSIENTGLYYKIVEPFQEKTGIIIDGISVGTGKALELGRRGDVDLIIVHNKQAEDKFLADEYGVNRRDVMHNNFIILGPKNDPAGIKNAETVFDALKALNENQHPFISRGDNSGTHAKELKLWKKIKIKPEGKWYQEAGQGMAKVILMANDKNAYTMSDKGTYLALKDKIDIVICYGKSDAALENHYGIIAINPETFKHVNYLEAMTFIAWMTSIEGQEIIRNFKKSNEQLYYPVMKE